MPAPAQPEPGDGLAGALHATGPAAPGMYFGQFVGSWRLRWRGTDTEGRSVSQTGELHVGWVLGGRAVQDVWIVPGPGEPGEGEGPLAFHGSTIRFYDPAIDAYRSTWIEPVNARVRRFLGRVDGHGGIILLSREDEPQLRWRFSDVTHEAFRWTAETSRDGGRSWTADEEMRASRLRT